MGRTASRELARCGIQTIGQLAHADSNTLQIILGKQGPQLKEYALGLDRSPVSPAGYTPPPKSISNGFTFPHNLRGESEIRTGFALLADQVSTRLRNRGMKCSTLQIIIRDPQFKDLHHQQRLTVPTFLSSELTEQAMEMALRHWNLRLPIRALTLNAANLIPEQEAVEQLDFFQQENTSDRRSRLEHLEKTIDTIRSRYGSTSISRASHLREPSRE